MSNPNAPRKYSDRSKPLYLKVCVIDAVNFGYTFDINRKYIQKARLYLTGRNLLTFTKFSGVDPASYNVNGLTPGATGSRNWYPATRQMIFGVQIDF